MNQSREDPVCSSKYKRKIILTRCRVIRDKINSGKDPFAVIQSEFLTINQLIAFIDVDPTYRRCDQLCFCELIFKFCYRIIQKRPKKYLKQIFNSDNFFNFFEKENLENFVTIAEIYVSDFRDNNLELTVDKIYNFIMSLMILYLDNELYNSLSDKGVKLIEPFVSEKLPNIRDNFEKLGFNI